MRLALAQMKMSENLMVNLSQTVGLIHNASEQGIDLVCFPEVQLTPFFPQFEKKDVRNWVLHEDDDIVQTVCNACQEAHIWASPNFYLEYDGKRYDTSLLIDREGHIIGRQKMVHIAQCPCFYEKDYYEPSDEGFHVFETEFGKVGIVVCFDRHYPESIRTEALMGADLVLVPTANTKDEPSDLFQWEIKIQAFHNSVFIAMCNRVGLEHKMDFSGESIVVGPCGDTIALAGDDQELLITELDLHDAQSLRSKKPYTQLRRPELYI